MKYFFKNRVRSVGYACEGLGDLVRSETNARVHFFVAVLVVIIGVAVGISAQGWALLVLAMALVLAAEAMNTAIEILCDLVNPDDHPQIKRIKDVSAAAVLLCAIAAAIIGLLVLSPALLALL